MATKHGRNNYRKNSRSKKWGVIFARMALCFRISAGITFLILISFGFIFIHDFLTQCDYFKAEVIQVEGILHLTKETTLQQAQMTPGVNILSVNLLTTRKRLLAHAWIAEAEVHRKLPNEIHIRITEHQPMAILDLGRKFLLNTQGQVFKEVSASDSHPFPVIRGLEFTDIGTPGDPPSVAFESVMHILCLGQKTESIIPNQKIKEIHVDKEIGLTLYTPDIDTGKTKAIKLGYHDYPEKLDRLKELLLFMKSRHDLPDFASIDLNKSNRIVVSPATVEMACKSHKEV